MLVGTVDVASLGIHPTNPPELNSTNAEAALAALAPLQGQRWTFGIGTYRFARSLVVARKLSLEGCAGGFAHPQSKLLFPDGSHGLVFANDLGSESSAGSAAVNLWIESEGKTKGVGHGVVLKAAVHLAELFITGFRGDGVNVMNPAKVSNANGFYLEHLYTASCGRSIRVESLSYTGITAGDLGEFRIKTDSSHGLVADDRFLLHSPYWVHTLFPYRPATVADPKVFHCGNYIVRNVISPTEVSVVFADGSFGPAEDGFYSQHPDAQGASYEVITGNGIFVRGDDSNGGIVLSCLTTGNAGWGVLDYSFLGNVYVGCLAEANTLGAYNAVNRPTSACTFIGNYAEGDQPPSVIAWPAVIHGGTHGSRIKRLFPSHLPRFFVGEEVEKLTAMGLRQTDYVAKPADGQDSPRTWERGDRVSTFAWAPPPGDAEGYLCDTAGTFSQAGPSAPPIVLPTMASDGTRIVRATCVDKHGNPVLCALPDFGEYVRLQGKTVRVEHKVLLGTETHFVMSGAVPAGNAPAEYSRPAFKRFGMVRP